MSLYIRCIGLASFLLACPGSPVLAKNLPASVEASNDKVPIIVMIGGFNSCPSRLWGDIHQGNMGIASRRLLSMVTTNNEVADTEYVVSCFLRSNQDVRFVSSYDEGEREYYGHKDALIAEVTTLASRHPNHRVYIAGHSYGGWLAMYLAEHLPAWVNISLMMTLDPISTVNCRPTTFIRSYLSSTWRVNPAQGCTESPTDLSTIGIGNRVRNWLNYYQVTYSILHSGYIAQAKGNAMLSFDTTYFLGYKAHVSMEEDDRVWTPFHKEVALDLAMRTH